MLRRVALIDFDAREAAEIDADLNAARPVLTLRALQESVEGLFSELQLALGGVSICLAAELGVIGKGGFPRLTEQDAPCDKDQGKEDRTEAIHGIPSLRGYK